MNIPETCKECGSNDLTFEAAVHNNGGCQDGRIKVNEVSGIFILGCNNCSETCAIIPANQVAEYLNEQIQYEKTIDIFGNA